MRTLCAFVLFVLFSTLTASASDNNASGLSSLPPAAQANISAALGRDSAEFYAQPVSGGFEANSRGLAARFTSTSVEVSNGNARWGLRLSGYGYGDALRRVTSVAPHSTKNRVEYRRGTMTEWYVNGPMGLEQGFTIGKRSGRANGKPLTIALETSGNVMAVDDGETGLRLTGANRHEELRYAGLTAYDADGRDLRATLQVRGPQLLLQVDDRNARYPVVVDPVVQLAKLTATDGSQNSLGISVAMSGDVIVAGTFANAAYVYVKPPSGWKDMTQTAKLTPSDGISNRYVSVAISGNVILLGEPDAVTNGGTGVAYAFVKPPSGWRDMRESAKLLPSDGQPSDRFGVSVAVSGGTAVVGAHQASVNGNVFQGATYVFVRPNGRWAVPDRLVLLETAKVTTSDGSEGDFFGNAVAISGDTIAVGAPGAQQGLGEAYVFVKPQSGWTNGTENATLKASDGGGQLGASIATNGTTVVAGSSGGVGKGYIFAEPMGGWVDTTETAQLVAQKIGWNFGQSVAIDGTGHVIAVGAPQGNGHKNGAGDVFVFVEPPNGWQTTSKFTFRLFASDGKFNDQCGTSVALGSKTLLTGAPGAGAAYVFGSQ